MNPPMSVKEETLLMDEGGPGPWIISALLILFAAYAAVAETSLASVSRIRMKTLSERGSKSAGQVLDALDHFDRTISTLLICTNIAHLGAASLITLAVTRIWGLSAVTLSTFGTTLVVFFVGEMLPKSIAKKYADSLSLWCIRPLTALIWFFRPASALLSKIGNLAVKQSPADPAVTATEEELHDIIDDMTEEGTLDEEHGELISSALRFNDLTVESVLTPRVDMDAIDIADSPSEILSQIREQTHSRLPVYEEDADHIIGILRIRRYLRAYLDQGENVNIRKLLDEPYYVTESAKINELLARMSRDKQSLAIVSDHYGGTVGIVTTEDILETLVGDIYDEEDEVEESFVDLKNGCYLVDAEENVYDVFEEIGFEDPEEDEELRDKRLGEWVYEHFQSVPRVQEHFDYHGLKVYVARMDHNRILKVMLKAPSHPSGKEAEA